eukprot:scaffold90859_cov37-Prasinocladus_malaysianus.AAC.1
MPCVFNEQIFGPSEDEALDVEGTTKAFEALAEECNAEAARQGLPAKSLDEVAYGFIKVQTPYKLLLLRLWLDGTALNYNPSTSA